MAATLSFSGAKRAEPQLVSQFASLVRFASGKSDLDRAVLDELEQQLATLDGKKTARIRFK